jgi:hypothetical protein
VLRLKKVMMVEVIMLVIVHVQSRCRGGAEMHVHVCRGAEVQVQRRCRGGAEEVQRCRGGAEVLRSEVLERCRGAEEVQGCRVQGAGAEVVQRR